MCISKAMLVEEASPNNGNMKVCFIEIDIAKSKKEKKNLSQ